MPNTNLVCFAPGSKMSFNYTNDIGATRRRTIILESLAFGQTIHHPEPQWFLNGYDVEQQERRTFALKYVVL